MRHVLIVSLVLACFAQAACNDTSERAQGADSGTGSGTDSGTDAGADAAMSGASMDDAATPAEDVAPVALERPFRSGSRLVAEYYRVPGLPDAFLGLVDTQTGFKCAFAPTAGGTLRCLPAVSAPHGLIVVGYRDAQCEDPIYRHDETCATHATVITRIGDDCDNEATVHALSPLASPVPLYQVDELGACEVTGTMSEAGALGVSAAQPAEDYVAGVHKLIAHDGELTRQVIVGDDGSVHPGEIVVEDPLLVCRAEFTPEPRNCHLVIPTYFEGSAYFTDDACTMPALHDYAYSYTPAECPAPEYLIDVEYFFESNHTEYGVRRVTGKVTDAVYSSLGGACVVATDQAWSPSLYEVGERVAVPKLVGALIAGGGGLSARVIQDEAGTTLGYPGGVQGSAFYQDSMLDRPCEVREVGGEHLCLPGLSDVFTLQDGANPNNAFSDADCTEELTYCNKASCEQTLWVTTGPAVMCGRVDIEALWTIEERFEGTRYRRDDMGACVEDMTGFSQWIRVPRGLDSLATVERVTEEPSAP